MNKIIIKVPTKLMLSGEWAVLEPKSCCISLAINKYVYAEISQNKKFILLNFPQININSLQATFDCKAKKLLFLDNISTEQISKMGFARLSIENSLKFLLSKNININSFSLAISSGETLIGGQKVGLGSSAAVCVAVVKAILKIHNQNIVSQKNLKAIYKIAAISHFQAQGKIGSGYDVATSVFGKSIIYGKVDERFLKLALEQKNIEFLFEKPWPSLFIKSITLPPSMTVNACFCGQSASTALIVEKINKFKKEKKDLYFKFVKEIKKVTFDLIQALEANNQQLVIDLIKENAKLLSDLGDASGSGLETKALKKAIDLSTFDNAAGKFSGAGGGDCAIAVTFDKQIADKILENWRVNKLIPLDIKIL
ncbi:TPA: phosphomevalonate kinase [Candidatus Dependentiae bacterium]|nr:MAG: phosphomevalonate kinase [candidate division TM6 bacterium GW2011_GWE2_31_21]KKP53754.1 MAG: phosphomevalonate kinase [candidate division TM6 bacterium GW2011_GWF2_33_332]HBS48492.1 phosphomevalonate kinase [Candidatus Dependentiae bacterium]HBZ73107.1 phosphomevalonate kinase [Candidatus Dependentiae bacterium]